MSGVGIRSLLQDFQFHSCHFPPQSSHVNLYARGGYISLRWFERFEEFSEKMPKVPASVSLTSPRDRSHCSTIRMLILRDTLLLASFGICFPV